MDKLTELDFDNFILLLDKNRRLVNCYSQKYKKIVPLKNVESRLESLLVTFLDLDNVSLSLKKKIITSWDLDQLEKNPSILTPLLAGNTYQLDFLLNELSLLIPLLIEISEKLEIDFNSLKNNNEHLKSLWSENFCGPQLVEGLYFRTHLTVMAIHNLFRFIIRNKDE